MTMLFIDLFEDFYQYSAKGQKISFLNSVNLLFEKSLLLYFVGRSHLTIAIQNSLSLPQQATAASRGGLIVVPVRGSGLKSKTFFVVCRRQSFTRTMERFYDGSYTLSFVAS